MSKTVRYTVYSNREQAFGGQAGMLRLIEGIYDAAQDATLWPAALGMISDAVNGESIALFAGFPDLRTPDLYSGTNFASGAWEGYSSYYATINPIMERCEALFSAETPWLSHLAMPDAELEKTEFYNDFFRTHDMHFSLGLRLEFEGLPSAALSCQRSKSMGAFNAQECVVFQTLRPHLHRAIQVHHRISTLEARSLGLETALNAHGHAVVGVDAEARVCLSNQVALDLFTAGDGLYVSNGRLFCTRPDENVKLQRMLVRETHGAGTHDSPVSALVVSRINKAQLHLCVLPMKKQLAGRSSSLAALVFISDTARTPSRSSLIRHLYGVTPAEARVADLLLQGLDLREIAARLRITLETTRFQMKRLLVKTGTRRQVELLRLLATLPGIGAIDYVIDNF